jgi:hypothetical protein
MAITLEGLQELLSAPDVRLFSDGVSALLYPFAHRGQTLNVEITLYEEGAYVRFLVPYYLNLYAAEDPNAMMLKLLERNRYYKLLKFACDPTDGEVSVSIELPIQDGELTQEQAVRCMRTLTDIAVQERDRLLTLQQTGIYPSSDDPQFTDSVERILEGSGAE